MRDILSDLDRWQRDGGNIALATVVQTWGSSPRRAGAKMGLASEGQFSGSVSGGCVENAVIEAGIEALKTKRPKLLHFGVTDETAWEVGLACGGSIDVFVNPMDKKIFQELNAVIENEEQAVIVTLIRGPQEILGREILIHEDGRRVGVIDSQWDGMILELANDLAARGISHRVSLSETVEIFADVILPAPTLIIVGGVHIAVALSALARPLNFRTVVIDPRRAWGNRERFPNADQLIQAWPEEAFEKIRITRSTAIVMLTHDPKLDDPALKIALKSRAFYIGALGSKTTNEKRRARLLNEGISESQFAKLNAPIGLDIGAQTPEEIALAIMAEVVKASRKQDQANVKEEAKYAQSTVFNH